MVNPLDRFVARKLLTIGLAWERSLPREVWIITLCRDRYVYDSYDEARQEWDWIQETFKGKCDYPYAEIFCTRPHTLLKGMDEMPLRSFQRMMRGWYAQYLHENPGYKHELPWERENERLLQTLPPLDIRSSGNPTSGVVYVIQSDDPCRHIKIGRSFSAGARIDQLQIGNSYELRVLREIPAKDAAALENALHRRYARFRLIGEWFALPGYALEEVLVKQFIESQEASSPLESISDAELVEQGYVPLNLPDEEAL